MPERTSLTFVVKLEAPSKDAARIASALETGEEGGPEAVSLFECGNGRIELLAHYAEEPSRTALSELLRAAIGGAKGDGVLASLRIEPLMPRDWIAASESYRGPVHAGRFYLHGSHDRHRAPRRRGRVEIDAGLAFGTGLHASTQGCLLALDRLLKREGFGSILDVGTGTGILAIAAAKALEERTPRILASDADPIAVAVAQQNARANGVASRLRLVSARGFTHPLLRRSRADLIFANLTSPVLKRLAPELSRHTRPGGKVILSGIEEARAAEVSARYRAFGFRDLERIVTDGWATLIMQRFR